MESNIISANFGGYYKVRTDPAWLIDHGMQLAISGIDLPDEFECHFSNSRSVAAKRQIGEDGVVTIPDEYFLSNAAQIFCWIYLHPTVDSGVTEYEIVIPLRPRPNVDPAEPTQEQQDIVDQAIAALNVAMAATSADAESASASATAAQAAVDSVLNMTVSADTLPSGSDASVTKSVVDDAVHLAFGIPQGAQGVQGEQGVQGVQGPTGATPNFTIGTVQTLLPTQDATATITGTAEAPVLNLGIPKGATGEVSEAELTAALENKADIIVSSASGSIASFVDGADDLPMKSAVASITPTQNLNGYDHPWPAGGGTNLIPLTVDTIKAANGGANTWNGNSKTINGVTYTILTDEAGNVTGINANGTATSFAKLNLGTIHAVSGTTYGIKKFNADDGGNFFGNIKPRFSSATDANISRNTTMTADSDKDVAVSYYIMSGMVANNRLITPFIAVTSIAPTVFAPYSNICPISGLTGLSVYVSPTQDPDDATVYNVEWSTQAGTVYGGMVDVVTGVLTVDMVNIPSYNGETINEPWLSSMDEYTPGATPTTGAQVVYKLATPLTYQLTPQEVKSLLGQNNVWSNGGTLSVTYRADTKLYIDNKITQAIAAALNS